MYTLYYYPDNASLAPHMCLIHARAPYQLVLVDRAKGALDSDWFRALNPQGKIPAMTVGDPAAGGFTMTESAAICLKIAEDLPGSALMPPVGTVTRGHALRWLFHLTNSLQADCSVYNYARRYAETRAGIEEVRAATGARLGALLGHIDRHLAAEPGPWLVGEQVTAADYFLLMVAGWLEQFKVPDPPTVFPTLLAYLRRAQALPAAAEAYRIEGDGPFF